MKLIYSPWKGYTTKGGTWPEFVPYIANAHRWTERERKILSDFTKDVKRDKMGRWIE